MAVFTLYSHIVFSSRQAGGLLTNEDGYVVAEWRYNLGAHLPSPSGSLTLKLNKNITLEFRDRSDMRIRFAHEGVSRDLEVGVKSKREGSYLDNRYGTRRTTYAIEDTVINLQ